MNARILTAAAMATALCGVLPARAADSRLVALMMPDAKVIAGVNVDQAKVSPFGQWVLGQMQPGDNQFKELKTLTGFDPVHNVHELLVGSNSTAATAQKGQPNGLVAVLGDFDVARINGLAASHPEATTETYNGVTIIEDPKKTGGIAILSPMIAIAGDLANVKAAIDRYARAAATTLPASVGVQVQSWSASQDAWVVTTVPPSSLAPTAGMPPIPGVGAQGQNNAFQNIQNAAAGVKFGNNVVVTAQALAANDNDAKQMGDVVKLLASLAQMQSNADPNLAVLVKSLNVTTSGPALNISLSLPQDTLVQILKSGAAGPRHAAPRRVPARKM